MTSTVSLSTPSLPPFQSPPQSTPPSPYSNHNQLALSHYHCASTVSPTPHSQHASFLHPPPRKEGCGKPVLGVCPPPTPSRSYSDYNQSPLVYLSISIPFPQPIFTTTSPSHPGLSVMYACLHATVKPLLKGIPDNWIWCLAKCTGSLQDNQISRWETALMMDHLIRDHPGGWWQTTLNFILFFKVGRGFGTNAGEWIRKIKLEIRTEKYFPGSGQSMHDRYNFSDLLQDLKGRIFVSSGFSTERILISAWPAAPHCVGVKTIIKEGSHSISLSSETKLIIPPDSDTLQSGRAVSVK